VVAPGAKVTVELLSSFAVVGRLKPRRTIMTFGRGILLWLIGIPLPIILLLALFWHH
jgi:hypothetical protein